MSLKILIVEDEHLGMERLERQLASINKDIEIVGTTDSVASSVRWLKSNSPPDLILMDIDLGDGQSFEIFKQVDIRCHVIFTTSYDEHALHAFESNNIDFLLKPIRKADLVQSLDRYMSSDLFGADELHEIENLVRSLKRRLIKGFRQRILAKDGKKIISIELSQVYYFIKEDNGNYLRTKDKRKLIIEHSLDDIEASVDPQNYFRVNGECLVGHDGVSKTQRVTNGQLALQLRAANNKTVFVEQEKTSAFKNWLKSR